MLALVLWASLELLVFEQLAQPNSPQTATGSSAARAGLPPQFGAFFEEVLAVLEECVDVDWAMEEVIPLHPNIEEP
jgi:hypothetical protein